MLVIPTKVGKGATVSSEDVSMQKDAIAQPFTSAELAIRRAAKSAVPAEAYEN